MNLQTNPEISSMSSLLKFSLCYSGDCSELRTETPLELTEVLPLGAEIPPAYTKMIVFSLGPLVLLPLTTPQHLWHDTETLS